MPLSANTLDSVVNAICQEVEAIVKRVFEGPIGINRKTGTNTLADSDLLKQMRIEATATDDLVVSIFLNDYITYVESGRRAGAKMPPYDAIEKWAAKKGIPTDASTIYLIRRAISRDGIAPRPLMQTVFDEAERMWDGEWSKAVYDSITNKIDQFFAA